LIASLFAARRSGRLSGVAWFGGYMLVDAAVSMGAVSLNPALFDLSYNWLGKVACALIGLIFVFLGPLRREEVGLCRPRRWSGGFQAILLAIVIVGFVYTPNLQASRESFLYELTLPGIAEELTYRGILLAFLLRAYGNDTRGQWLAALVTSIAFGCVHDLDFHGWQIVCPTVPFVFHIAMGLFFAWIRLTTVSLLMPILAHNADNTAGELGGLWRLYFGLRT
jgi:membrane protease YdiL (CAAX protease family)